MVRRNRWKEIGVSWNSSIMARIIVTFLVILLPLYVLGVVFYESALRVVRDGIMDSMVNQVSFYMDDLDKEMERVWMLQYDMVNDVYLERLSAIPESLDDIDRMQVIQNIQHRMEAIVSSSRYISGMTIYIPSISRKITYRGVDDLDDSAYQRILDVYTPQPLLIYSGGQLIMLAESPIIENTTGQPVFVLSLELSSASFRDALAQFDKYPGSGSFLIHTSSSENIATANIDADVERQILSAGIGAAHGILQQTVNGRQVKGFYGIARSDSLGITLAMYIPENVLLAPLRQYSWWFVVFTIVAAVTVAAFAYSIYRFIHKPIMELVVAFEKVEEGNLNIAIEHRAQDEFRYLYGRFNAMVEKLDNLIRQVYTMRILTQRAELKQLQAQINPHFLYNSFFILHRRIKGGDYDNAIAFSQQLGNYFRFITRNAEDEVPLFREIEHAGIYTEIQRIRFSSRLSVRFDELPERYANLVTPRLVLQPLVENAFEHGLENKAAGGLLWVRFEPREQYLTICVEDNGEDLTDEELHRLSLALQDEDEYAESTGIRNIHRRVLLRFGPPCGIRVCRSELGGLRVELTLRQEEG